MSKVNREIKSSVFTSLFQNCSHAKEYSLELYNSIEGTNYTDPELIKHIDIDVSIYRSIKNDVSFLIENKIIMLVEHQSTVNPNMPLRALMYIGRLYEKLVDQASRYRTKLLKIPTPEIYVFYNGTRPYPDETTLYLSDAFMVEKEDCPIEVKVKVFNIGIGRITKDKSSSKNIEILEKCQILKEYSEFMNKFERCKHERDENATRKIIEECIREGILKDYLEEVGDEVMSFLTAEYDYDMDIKVNREEAFEDGLEQGIKQGIEQGIEQGKDLNAINNIKNIMKSLNCDVDKAMELVGTPEDKKEEYKNRIESES